jgi:hypothetical protein
VGRFCFGLDFIECIQLEMGGHRETPVAADLSLGGLGFHLLSAHLFDSF